MGTGSLRVRTGSRDTCVRATIAVSRATSSANVPSPDATVRNGIDRASINNGSHPTTVGATRSPSHGEEATAPRILAVEARAIDHGTDRSAGPKTESRAVEGDEMMAVPVPFRMGRREVQSSSTITLPSTFTSFTAIAVSFLLLSVGSFFFPSFFPLQRGKDLRNRLDTR